MSVRHMIIIGFVDTHDMVSWFLYGSGESDVYSVWFTFGLGDLKTRRDFFLLGSLIHVSYVGLPLCLPVSFHHGSSFSY